MTSKGAAKAALEQLDSAKARIRRRHPEPRRCRTAIRTTTRATTAAMYQKPYMKLGA